MAYVDHISVDGVQYDIRDVEAVSFEQEQTLNDVQQEQARANIGAGSEADVADLKSHLNAVDAVLPKSDTWNTYSYTKIEGKYRNRNTGIEANSQYASYIAITNDGKQYKVTGTFSNNAQIVPVLYVSDNGTVLGYEPSDSEATLTDYVLTIPNGTNTIYLNGPVNMAPSVYVQETGYANCAPESELAGKLDAPSVVGTEGQVITADANGDPVWAEIPLDSTLKIAGVAADAKATGDAIAEVKGRLPVAYNKLTLTEIVGKYMQLSLVPRDLAAYRYAYVVFEADTTYKVSTKCACNSALAPVIYVDSDGNFAGQYPTTTSSSDIILTDELLVIPSGAVGMYVNGNTGAYNTYPISVYAGQYADVEPAIDYTQYSWNAVGDSITYNGRYEDEVKSILGLPYTNGGVSGSTLAINNTYMTGQSIVERVLAGTYTDADVWTIMGGLNDCLYDSTLGQLATAGSTFDKTTVYGALQAICEYVLNLRAHPRLILITPTQSVRDNWTAESHPTTMALIRKAVLDVADYYSITCFDAWAKGGISAYNIQKATNPTTSDGVHLNVLGADILGEKLALVIKDELFGINDD